MPRSRPPQRTKHGSLHASAVRARPLPVRTTDFERDVTVGPGPLAGLHRPTPYDSAGLVMVSRNLDKGRLSAKSLIAAAGWGPSIALDADASCPQRVGLRPAVADRGPVAGSPLAHTDALNRIVVSEGLRTFLGIGEYDLVLAWTEGAVVCIAPAGAVIDAFAASDHLAGHRSQHPQLTAVRTA